MDFGDLRVYDFSGYRFYYSLNHSSHILIQTCTSFLEINSMKRYDTNKFNAFIRLTNPEVNFIHDNLEIRLDKRHIKSILEKYPDYYWALKGQLEKMSIYASNLRFHLTPLLSKIQEILSDYSQTNYHKTADGRKNFVRRVISNFDQYLKLDELPLNWVNFLDCLVQYPSSKPVFVVNTWRSFLVLKNNSTSGYGNMYYPYSEALLQKFELDENVQILHLGEKNIDRILNLGRCRILDSTITKTNPVRTI